jgi:hypothetical protein
MKRLLLAMMLVALILPSATLADHGTIFIEPREPAPYLPADHPWRGVEHAMTLSRYTAVDALRWMSRRAWATRLEEGPVAAANRLAEIAQEREEAVPQPAHDVVYVSSRFGPRFHPVLHRWRPHNGVDFAAPRGTPIRAVEAGKVTHSGWLGAAGRAVVLEHDGYTSHYAHMSRIARGLRRGDTVEPGEVIGYVGASGRATGHHLHFGIKIDGKWVDPLHDGLERLEPIEDAEIAVGLERGFHETMSGIQTSARSAVESLGVSPPQSVDLYDDNFL